MGEMALSFVPEGQADSSQARSAWVAVAIAPVPEGRSKSLSVPEIFVVARNVRYFLLKGMLASNLSRDPFNRPAGTGLFSS
jgi:hypothetical protein